MDFSKHAYTKTVIEQDGLRVTRYALTLNGGLMYRVVFTNIREGDREGECLVTGDFGRWSFCREWHPEANRYVDRNYMDEKLRIGSNHSTHEFSSETLRNNIATEILDEATDDSRREILEYLRDQNPSDEQELIKILDDLAKGYEDAPSYQRRKPWLDIVYDAFEEMNRREYQP